MRFLFLMALLTLGCLSTDAQIKKVNDVIAIRSGQLWVNKKQVNKNWAVQPILAALGKPSHIQEGYNKTHTYDRGIVLFEKMKDKKPLDLLSEIQIYFLFVEKNKVVPSDFFEGKMTIEDLVISSDLSYDKVKATLTAYEESPSYMEHNYRLAKNGLYIFFQFSEDEKSLEKVSIGQDLEKTDTHP